MDTFDLIVGLVVGVLAAAAAILALLVVCVWLLGQLRRLLAASRPRPERPMLSVQERRP
jgi:hypothetical protein